MSSQFDEFDLDVRFHPDSVMGSLSAGPPAEIHFTRVTCQAACEKEFKTDPPECVNQPVKTVGPGCVVHIPPTVEATCPNTCRPGECNIKIPPTAIGHTCEDTCAPRQTCPAHTCGLDCETDTCPDATCGCNTNETCNQQICDGGGITSPPCQDLSAGEDTCDACQPPTGGQPCDTMGGCPPGG